MRRTGNIVQLTNLTGTKKIIEILIFKKEIVMHVNNWTSPN